MEIPIKKTISGFILPVFGFGTWEMGGRVTRNLQNDDKADVDSIKAATNMGITHIDTAAFYANGHTEKLVAKALHGLDRSKFIITTKVTPMNFRYKNVIKSLQGSLKRLKTDCVEVCLLHAPNPYIPIEETMQAMDYLVDKNLIKHIGLSNFSAEQFEQAQKCTDNKIVCDHVHYNIKHRLPQKDGSIKYAQDNDALIVAWRPIQKGLFGIEKNKLIENMCAKYDRTPNQIAINWLISQKNVTVITKCGNINHLKENLGALGWEMEKKDLDLITNNFPGISYSADIKTLIDNIKPC